MSRDAGDSDPPRRRKPSARKQDPNDPFDDNGPSTFRPNTKRNRPPDPPTEPDDQTAPTTYRRRPKKAASKLAEHRPLDEPDAGPTGSKLMERILFGSVGTAVLANFCRQFSAYLDAGVDLIKSLGSLEKQFARTALGPVVKRLRDSVRRGDAFADAVAREPKAFDKLFVAMVRVAEARGGMPETLRIMSAHYEARLSLIRQARSAMIYPVVVIFVAGGVVGLLTIFILPMLVGMLREMAGPNADFPTPTRLLMNFSMFVQWIGWWLIPITILGFGFGLTWWYKTKAGKRFLDNLLLMVPVFGKLLKQIDTTRFARTLAALTEAGLDINSSLELTADVLRLDPFQRAVRNARHAVMDGEFLSDALNESHRFGHDVIAIVQSGEETGKLPETLQRLADDYEEQVAYTVRNLGQLVQPVVTIVLGGIVGFIVLSFVMAYISILSNAGRM
jgi:type II secretory pathway component PulF